MQRSVSSSPQSYGHFISACSRYTSCYFSAWGCFCTSWVSGNFLIPCSRIVKPVSLSSHSYAELLRWIDQDYNLANKLSGNLWLKFKFCLINRGIFSEFFFPDIIILLWSSGSKPIINFMVHSCSRLFHYSPSRPDLSFGTFASKSLTVY